MNNPILDHGYLGLPSSTDSTFILPNLSLKQPQPQSTTESSDRYEAILADAQAEIDRYKKQVEEMRAATLTSPDRSKAEEVKELKQQNSRSLLQVQSLLEQNELLRKQNNRLNKELQQYRDDSKRKSQFEESEKILEAFLKWIRGCDADLSSLTPASPSDYRTEVATLRKQTEIDASQMSPSLTTPLLFSSIQNFWQAIIKALKLETVNKQELFQLKAELDLLKGKEAPNIDPLVTHIKNLETTLAEWKNENEALKATIGSKQSLNGELEIKVSNPLMDQLGSELHRKKNFEKLLGNIKSHVTEGFVDRESLWQLFDSVSGEIKNSLDAKKIFDSLRNGHAKEEPEEADEDLIPTSQATVDQIRHLQETIDEHIRLATKLKQENTNLKDDVATVENKLTLREEAWIAKAKELDAKYQQSVKSKKDLDGILRQYADMYSQLLTFSPLKPSTTSPEEQAHPLPFLKHQQQLHSMHQATCHTMELLKSKADETKKAIQQEKMRTEAYAQQLKETQHRSKQAEAENEQATKKIASLQSALAEVTTKLEETAEERDMLETKLMRVGEGFFKIMA